MVVTTLTQDVHGKPLPCKIDLDSKLLEEIRLIPDIIAHEWDAWGLFFGRSGAGKSHMAQRCALFLNADFGLKDIFFTVEQLEEWVDSADVGDVGIFDEADVISSHGRSAVFTAFKRYAKQIRDKQLVIFLCTPTMKDMNNYFVDRALFISYVYAPDYKTRGYYNFYSGSEQPARLYAAVKKAWAETPSVFKKQLATIKNGYIAQTIHKGFPIVPNEYKDKKERARRQLLKTKGGAITKSSLIDRRKHSIKAIMDFVKTKYDEVPTQKELADSLGVSKSLIQTDIQEIKGAST